MAEASPRSTTPSAKASSVKFFNPATSELILLISVFTLSISSCAFAAAVAAASAFDFVAASIAEIAAVRLV